MRKKTPRISDLRVVIRRSMTDSFIVIARLRPRPDVRQGPLTRALTVPALALYPFKFFVSNIEARPRPQAPPPRFNDVFSASSQQIKHAGVQLIASLRDSDYQ
jgi:hypothetical protein